MTKKLLELLDYIDRELEIAERTGCITWHALLHLLMAGAVLFFLLPILLFPNKDNRNGKS